MGTHTYSQTVKLEVARDILNGRIAEISAQLDDVQRQASPDAALIEKLESEMTDLGVQIDRLDVRDEKGIDALIAANQAAAAAH